MYASLLEKIFSAYPMYHKVGTAAYKEGLENIETLAEITGHPEKKIKTIHIAGTNGKGSVAHLLSSFFQEKGYKTGLYTSPHLVDFSERIKINGQNIPERKVLDFFDEYQQEFDKVSPSFFEMTTMLAFDYFVKEKVDIAIIETGLGGRLDSTNIITPLLSIITNISLDHTQLLGNNLSQIATEKAGIIKEHVPCVIGEYNDTTFSVFEAIAKEKQAPLNVADKNYRVEEEPGGKIAIFKRDKLWINQINNPLSGKYQLKNIATFLQSLEVLQLDENPEYIVRAIENVLHNTNFSGRWHIIEKEPLTICDVGHNTAGVSFITEQLRQLCFAQLHFVFGMVNDKDIDEVLSLLPKEKTTYYICRADIERALEPETLNQKMKDLGFNTILCTSVEKAYDMAQKNAQKEDVIFIGGSCFVVGDFLKIRKR